MFSSILSKFKFLLPYLLVLPLAFLLSLLALDPEPRVRRFVLLCGVIIFFLVAKQRYLLFPVLFLAYFPRPLTNIPYIFNSTNGLILVLCSILFLRAVVEKFSPISYKRIANNPFFLPSIFIWTSYLIAWIIAYASHSGGMTLHTQFLCGITYALLLGNLIIGFVQDKASFRYIQLLFLLILVLNLIFGLIFFFKPGLVVVPNIIEDRSVIASQAYRLGGLTFAWEAYAEYLMMSLIILLGLLSNRVFRHNRKIRNALLVILLVTLTELLLTNTRGAIALALAGIWLVFLFYTSIPMHKKLTLILGALLLVGTALMIAYQTNQLTLFDRLDSFNELQATEFGYIPAERAEVWLPVIRHILKNGLMGSGPSYIPLTHWGGSGILTHWPHNLILLLLTTIGIIGFASYCFLLLRIVRMKSTIFRLVDFEQRIFYLMLWIALLLFFIDTMKFDGFLRITNSYFYHIWITLGFFFSAANLIEPQGKGHA